MSLDPTPDVATLLRMKAEREQRSAGNIASRLSQPPENIASELYPLVDLRLPWSCLVSDNFKFIAFLRGGKPAMKIQPEYAEAKERIAGLARDVMAGHAPFDCPLSFTARVWYPNKQARDLTNWCKLVHDALVGIVYADDRWLRDVRWLHAGVDVDAPHARITIRPLLDPSRPHP